MMLFNLMVRLLAVVALAGLWVGPAVCMDNVSQIITDPAPDTEPAAISTPAKKVPDENTYRVDLLSSVVSSKALPRSAIDTKELMKIFNIAYTNNESRVLSQPLNYYELPDGESVKRDFRSVKNENALAESQMKGFSSTPWVADKTLNAGKDTTNTNVPFDVDKCVHGNDSVFSEFVFEVMTNTDAMVDTINFFASTLQNQIEPIHSNGLELESTMPFRLFIVISFLCSLSVALALFICYRVLLILLQKSEPYEFEGENFDSIKNVYLTMALENDIISCVYVHANEDLNNGINEGYLIACMYPPPRTSINEILLEAMQM